MINRINATITFFIIIIGTYFVCKHIENIELKKQIKILCALLTGWIIIRIIKYELIQDEEIARLFWYLYYFPILFSATTFFHIGTWHNKNKKYIKILKNVSFIGSTILFLFVLTNNFHNLVFNFNGAVKDFEKNYHYGIVYYLCFIWILLNVAFSIISAMRNSKGLYKKQKVVILMTIFLLIFGYAIGYMKRNLFSFTKDFSVIYSLCYMLALIIIVYKEKYRILLEENLYQEIEDAIKDKTILINKLLNNITKSKNPKRDLAYIKLLISYCKNKSNLIVTQKNKEYYTSEELKILIEKMLQDASSLGVYGAVNIVNKFEISVYIISIIYDYLHNLLEYANQYQTTNILICIKNGSNLINIQTMLHTEEELVPLEYNFEINQYINNKKIIEKQSKSEDGLSMELKIPVNQIALKENNLTEKEIKAVLEIKSKVHDILGQRLSVVSKIVEDEKIDENKINEAKPLLKNILNDLENDKLIQPKDMLDQIIYSCELVETKVYMVGTLPKNYIKAITLVKVIRECTTNAIRHAQAKNIYITIIQKDKIYMTISNEGDRVENFCEGDGIKGIKNRIEELNGSLEIDPDEEFSVKVIL